MKHGVGGVLSNIRPATEAEVKTQKLHKKKASTWFEGAMGRTGQIRAFLMSCLNN